MATAGARPWIPRVPRVRAPPCDPGVRFPHRHHRIPVRFATRHGLCLTSSTEGALQADIADNVSEELDVIDHVLVGTPARPSLPGFHLRHAKMERVPEVLQLPIEIQGRRPLPLEPQPLEKLDLFRSGGAAE